MKMKINPFAFICFSIGIGLIIVGFAEHTGLIGYRPHRQPVGAVVWFVAGAIITLVGFVIHKRF